MFIDSTKLEALFLRVRFTDIAVSRIAAVQGMESAATVVWMVRDGQVFYKSLIADLPADLPANRQDAAWA